MPLHGFKQEKDGMKLNGTHQLLICVDANVLGDSIHAMKKSTCFIGASKETSLEKC